MSLDESHLVPSVEAEDEINQTRQRIIQAAVKVFAEQGYTKATTRRIAAVADVNEVTIFRHFGNKQNLLAEVIQMHTDLTDLRQVMESLSGNYREDLHRLGMYFIAEMTKQREIFRVVMCDLQHVPELKEMMMHGPAQMRQMLTEYFERQLENGVLRSELQPEAVAQIFVSIFLLHRSMMHRLQKDVPSVDPETLVDQFIDILVHGTAKMNEF